MFWRSDGTRAEDQREERRRHRAQQEGIRRENGQVAARARSQGTSENGSLYFLSLCFSLCASRCASRFVFIRLSISLFVVLCPSLC